jgi:hypothetical protein
MTEFDSVGAGHSFSPMPIRSTSVAISSRRPACVPPEHRSSARRRLTPRPFTRGLAPESGRPLAGLSPPGPTPPICGQAYLQSFKAERDGFSEKASGRATNRANQAGLAYQRRHPEPLMSASGQNGHIALGSRHVRFTPKSGHCRATVGCPLSAISGNSAGRTVFGLCYLRTIVVALMVSKRAVTQSLKTIAPDDLDTVPNCSPANWPQLPMTRPPSMLTAWPVM